MRWPPKASSLPEGISYQRSKVVVEGEMAGGRGKCSWPSVAMAAATVFVVVILPIASAATSHVVGDSTGWNLPPNNNASFYADWASKQTFVTGDKLVFNFQTGSHTVAEVQKSSFDSCSTANQVGPTLSNGPATVTLTAGEHYYICSIPGHCSLGQKFSVSVSRGSPSPSSPVPSSPSAGGESPGQASGPAPPQKPGGPYASAPHAASLSLAAAAAAGLSLVAVAFW